MLKKLIFICISLFLIISVQGQEAIHNAAKAGDLDSVKKLLTADTSLLNRKDKNGLIPLHYASSKSLEVVIYLIEKGAHVNAKSKNGATPLYSAARFEQLAIAKYLLEHGANINAKSDGGSPLHQAVARSSVEMVELFLSYKADLTITDKTGQTVMHVAAVWNNYEIYPLLIAAGGNINAKDNGGNTPLHSCQSFMDDKSSYFPKLADILIKNKAFLNERNNAGLTPLGLAIQKGSVDMIKILNEAGAKE